MDCNFLWAAQQHFDEKKNYYAHTMKLQWKFRQFMPKAIDKREDEVKKHFVGAMLLTWVDKKP